MPLVEGGREFRALLLSSGCAPESSSPAYVRKLFRDLAARRPPPSSSARVGTGANGTASLRAGNPEARNVCLLLLHYCLADLGAAVRHKAPHGKAGGARGSGGEGGYKELAGLPFVPLADGSHGVFRCSAAVDASKLEMMKGMGFSEGLSRQALAKHKDVQSAVEWLSSGGAGNGGGGGERVFVLCAEEEASLLAGAGAGLINEAALTRGEVPAGSGAASGGGDAGDGRAGGAAAAAADDDGRVLRALRSSSLQSILNVTSMRDDLLPDLIGQTLPAAWRGSVVGSSAVTATAFSWKPGQTGHPDVDWFRGLWGYLASTRPSAVRLLAESFPVVPTAEAAVCPLSLRSAVIDGSRLGAEVRSILVKAGCRMLLPGVFAGGVDSASSDSAAAQGDRVDETSGNTAAAVKQGGAATVATAKTAKAAPRKQPLPPAPLELFEYVRPGTREGVLAALGTARRSAGKPLKALMSSASAAERDALREFLAREPASEMSDVEVRVCRELPIIPLHDQGLVAARALLKAAGAAAADTAKVTKATNGLRVPIGAKPSHGDGRGGYAAADTGPLYLLLEAGQGLVGVEGGGGGGGGDSSAKGDPSAGAASPRWLETHLFTPKFVKIGGSAGAGGREGAAEAALVERLGAELIGRAAFFVDHVFPRLGELPAGLRDAAMVEALLEAPRLSQQHQQFRGALSELKFVPTGDRVSFLFVLVVRVGAQECRSVTKTQVVFLVASC